MRVIHRAAHDRAKVDAKKLKQLMNTKRPDSLDIVVRRDVRKDAEGFEDVDDFWADDDTLQDDSVDDDDSLTASDKDESVDANEADTSGDLSEGSEHEVELPEIGSPVLDDRESMDIEKGPIPSQRSGSSRRSAGEEKDDAPVAPPSPARSDVSFDFGGGSPQGSVDMNNDEDDKAKAKARRRESFGGRGFDAEVASPFSVNDGAVTPMSNASDRNLKPIPSFARKDSVSPHVAKELFKKGGYSSDTSEPKGKKTKAKTAKKTAKRASAPRAKTPRVRPTGKYGYRTTPNGDTSIQSVQTDDSNDESFRAGSDTGGETGDDSYFNEPEAPKGPVRDRLPDASRILDDLEDDSDNNGTGLRRSKRKRFKPLAWFKSEHMVYERTFVGVGAVLPTVVGVERLGADLTDEERADRKKPKPPSKRVNNARPLRLDELPSDVKKRIIDGEWATLFDSQAGCMNDLNVICRSNEIRLRKLPTEERGGAVVHAYAGQSFNLFSPAPFARWISGRVVLPPGAWKEPEGVGAAVQLFYVTGCQPKSLELALAPETDDDFFTSKHTTHFLLSPGDEFYVPAGNVYYVKNHSSSADCDLRFTILKPEAPAAMSDENDSDGEKDEPGVKPEGEEDAGSALKRKREDDDPESDSV